MVFVSKKQAVKVGGNMQKKGDASQINRMRHKKNESEQINIGNRRVDPVRTERHGIDITQRRDA